MRRTRHFKWCARSTSKPCWPAFPPAGAVVTTGQKATDTLRAITGCGEPAVGECVPMPFAGRDLTLWRMPSSSRAFPRPVEWKAEFYRKVFSENGIL